MEFIEESNAKIISPTERATNSDECSICFEPLTALPTVHLCGNDGKHSCVHIYHQACIELLRPPLRCPYCRIEYTSTELVPKLEFDMKAWFDHLDADKDGCLQYEEILDGLKPQMVLDWKGIETEMDKNWGRWDKDESGGISYEEFADPDSGLLTFLQKNYPPKPRADPPNLAEDKLGWFEYWDEDKSNNLEKGEIVRALIKTFNLYHINASNVREIVENVWPIFDTDNSGAICKEEFVSTDNLADAIIVQLDFAAE